MGWPRSLLLIEDELLDAFDAPGGETERFTTFSMVGPETAVFWRELLGESAQPFLALASIRATRAMVNT